MRKPLPNPKPEPKPDPKPDPKPKPPPQPEARPPPRPYAVPYPVFVRIPTFVATNSLEQASQEDNFSWSNPIFALLAVVSVFILMVLLVLLFVILPKIFTESEKSTANEPENVQTL